MAASWSVLHGGHRIPLWVTFLPSVTVDRFTFPALEEDVIYDDVPCESPDAHQPGMASCGSFPGLSLGWEGRAMLRWWWWGPLPLLLSPALSVPTFHKLQIYKQLMTLPWSLPSSGGTVHLPLGILSI